MKKKLAKLLILVIIFFIMGIFFISLNKNSQYDTKHLIGYKIKDVNLNHFSSKKVIVNKDLKQNDFTLINFWASWCGPCRDEHPYLLKLSNKKKIKLLGVNYKDKKNNALKFLKALGNPYDTLAIDPLGKQSVNFGIYGIPESILIDKNLVILKKFVGPISNDDYKYILDIIK